MTARRMRSTGVPDTFVPTYAPAPSAGSPVRVIRDGRGNLLGHALRRPGSGRPSWRVVSAARSLPEVGVVPSLPWAAILLEQHRATGRRQRTGRFSLEVVDT